MTGKKALTVIVGVVCGAFVGLALSIVGVVCLVTCLMWAHPNDPSAGSVGPIVAIEIVPLGTMMGAVLGGLLIAKRPRFFLPTVLSIGILFLGCHLTFSTLREMDRPRNYVVRVSDRAGAEFVGGIIADGKLTQLKGNLPAEFKYQAKQVELAFALVHPKDGDKIAVEVLVNGTKLHRSESIRGIHEQFDSFGYAEWAGGTSYVGGGDMPAEHVTLLMQNAMPPKGIGWR